MGPESKRHDNRRSPFFLDKEKCVYPETTKGLGKHVGQYDLLDIGHT